MVNDEHTSGRVLATNPTHTAPARATGDVTLILSRIEQGEPQAAEQLLPLVYDELRKLAAAKMAQEKPGQTLQATALVHEAYIRLVDVEKAQHWNSRGHFFAAAAEAMRRILVEQARRKAGPKAVARHQRVELVARGSEIREASTGRAGIERGARQTGGERSACGGIGRSFGSLPGLTLATSGRHAGRLARNC